MKTWAVYGRNNLILLVFGLMSVLIIGASAMNIPQVSCAKDQPVFVAENVLSIAMVVYELLCAFFTCLRYRQALRASKRSTNTFEYIIFEQGMVWCFVVTALSVSAVVLLHVSDRGSFMQRILNALTLPISGILTARFLLHLRQCDSYTRTGGLSESELDHWEDSSDFRKTPQNAVFPDQPPQSGRIPPLVFETQLRPDSSDTDRKPASSVWLIENDFGDDPMKSISRRSDREDLEPGMRSRSRIDDDQQSWDSGSTHVGDVASTSSDSTSSRRSSSESVLTLTSFSTSITSDSRTSRETLMV